MKVVVFGTGNYYQAFKYLIEKDTIVGFLDNDNSKWGVYFDNKAIIYPPEEVNKLDFDRIYLACYKPKEMYHQLKALGISGRVVFDIRDAFCSDEEIRRYYKACSHNKNVYILCPYATTGGPEALHQLADSIYCNVTSKVYMVYISNDVNEIDKSPERYSVYKNGGIINEADIIDDDNSIVVLPEINVERINSFSKAHIYLWWLSVDNFFHHINRHMSDYLNMLNRVSLHMCQSRYAMEFLENCHISKYKIVEVSDYTTQINAVYIDERRENLVLYNPAKGFYFTDGLIEECSDSDIRFIAIENFNAVQVRDLMRKAKVYIDFGNHPGKDRLPREAATNGCIIITGNKGSAGNDFDINIPRKYKIDQDIMTYSDIYELIKSCVYDYDEIYHEFDNYRNSISREKDIFTQQVIRAFDD